uniref:Protein lingerer n=1 Tax=Riptortus pedestris TaxID=329032 RepID=R4WTE7_RIPPE|nr:protein lingerer [Riptortus pedestris]
MSLPSKARKTKGGDNSQTSGKTVKSSDSKQDASKQSDKSQPTAEQMRIAQIIDTKTEDPFLKEKLKQVMDATQKSIDDAYTALHDCDNDPNKAVNYLLEGIESEWSTSSKKKKNRTSSDKVAKEKEQPPQEVPAEEDSWDTSANSKPTVGNKGAPPRGRGRGFRGGRGSNSSNFQNNEPSERGRRGKVLNGPSRGRGNRGRMQTRGFGRGRAGFRRPIETWDPQRPMSSSLNHDTNSEDWDNEEYTGSLANSQIYTSSGTGTTPPAMNNSNSNSTSPNEYDKKNQIPIDSNSVKPVNNIAHKQQNELSSLSIPYKQYPSIPAMPEPAITPPMGVRSPPMGANLIMLPPRTDRPPISNQEMRMQRPRPKIPPPSKIPSTAVEMPPDSVENNIGLLDVQFGAMELNEASADSVQVSPPSPHHSPSPATSEKLLPHQAVATTDPLLLNETSFSPVRNNGTTSLSQISDLTAKVPDVTSSLYQESSYQVPYSKTAQQSPSVYSSTYSTGQKAWLNISTGSEETPGEDATHEPEEWKLLTSTATPISVPFNDFESVDNEVAMRTVLNSAGQQLPVDEQHEQEEQEEEVITPPSRTEVNSTSSIIYSTSSSQSTYSSSTGGVYGGISSSYPQYQYNNYPSQQNQSLPILTNSSNSYQSALGNLQYGSNTQSVYGTSGLPTPSYTAPYQTYNSTVQHNHKQTLLSSSSSNSKEFETTQPSVNLSSISHSGSINPTPTLLSASQTTPTSKPTSMSSMGKSTVVANMPTGVPPLVGTQYTIMGQGGIPYFQQPMYYEDLQLMPQQRLPPHLSTGYYEMGYPASTTREGVQYNMNDGRFARADNTSPVQASSISQQSGSQAHQQPMMNPTALPQAYAYFYGGSAMIPGNFQYGAPAIYPVAAGGTTSGHGNTNSGVYGKGPNNFTGNYGGNYENNQGSSSGTTADFKTSTSTGPKSQATQSANPSSNSDLVNMYSKSLSKSYEKQGFHCATPPPFNLGSQNSGMGPGGGYPQHLFIPAMTPHHNTTTLMHQPIHQDGSNTMSGRSQGGNQQPKVVMTKANYSSSTYWTQN